MSLKITAMVWGDRTLDPTAKLVAVRLAGFADDDGGRIFPSVGRVAADTGLSERAVRTALRRLEEAGALQMVGREDSGRHKAREYRICLSFFEGGTTCRAEPDAGRHDVPGGTTFRSGGHDVPPRGAPDAPDPLVNHQMNHHAESKAADVDAAFSDFWGRYPSRGPHANPRKPALARFVAAVKRGADPDSIIRGAENYAAAVAQERTEPRFVAQAVTWLHQERWTEYQLRPVAARRDDGWC